MALIESVFARGAYDRTMSFQTISEETRLPSDEVEHLIMKALRCLLSLALAVFGVMMLTKGTQSEVDPGFNRPG